tara:strand:+ start:1010 stop:1840 length:831 start_codon:yes stop_codon:yes gene_type:complete
MIIWLASYPKSGNTWIRMFLKSYFMKPEEKFSLTNSINDNFRIQSFPNEGLLNRLEIKKKFQEIVKNWEGMQDFINLNGKTNFIKTHNAMCTVGSYKFTSRKNTKGAIYIVRDPRDVLVSYAHHLGVDYVQSFNHLSSAYTCEYPSSGNERYKISLMGTWAEHYKSWKNYNSCKVLIIKYEDMILNEIETFKNIINYLDKIDGIKYDEEKFNKALNQTKFEELQKLEEKEGFVEKGKGDRFFRKGKIGSWKDGVPESIIGKVEKIFSKEMKELGYL